jgi:hypothetical protein
MGLNNTGIVLLCFFTCCVGCASTAPGKYARPIDEYGQFLDTHRTPAGLKISARELSSLASEHFGFVEVTFENTTSHWIHIERMNLSFGDRAKNQGVFVPWGSELESWRRAIEERNEVRETNAETALALLAIGGAVVAAASNDQPLKAAGGMVAVGALSTAFVRDVDRRVRGTEDAKPFPATHLLEVPFPVPPGLHSKRWIVLNTPTNIGCIDSMILDYDNNGGRRERVWADFRANRSEWQNKVCPRYPDRRLR